MRTQAVPSAGLNSVIHSLTKLNIIIPRKPQRKLKDYYIILPVKISQFYDHCFNLEGNCKISTSSSISCLGTHSVHKKSRN